MFCQFYNLEVWESNYCLPSTPYFPTAARKICLKCRSDCSILLTKLRGPPDSEYHLHTLPHGVTTRFCTSWLQPWGSPTAAPSNVWPRPPGTRVNTSLSSLLRVTSSGIFFHNRSQPTLSPRFNSTLSPLIKSSEASQLLCGFILVPGKWLTRRNMGFRVRPKRSWESVPLWISWSLCITSTQCYLCRIIGEIKQNSTVSSKH